MTTRKDTPTLADAIDHELELVAHEASLLWQRRGDLPANEEERLYALWAYQKRLRFLRVFTSIADPSRPLDRVKRAQLEAQFRAAVIAHGSATDDNARAAASSSLRVFVPRQRGTRGRGRSRATGWTALCVRKTTIKLAHLLVAVSEIVGTAEFYKQHLAKVPELERLAPEAWEGAYRVIMLTVDALFACDRYGAAPPRRRGPRSSRDRARKRRP
jgi:hypothetical protein